MQKRIAIRGAVVAAAFATSLIGIGGTTTAAFADQVGVTGVATAGTCPTGYTGVTGYTKATGDFEVCQNIV